MIFLHPETIMKAIGELKNEHQGIHVMLRVLERIAGKSA